MKRRIKKWTAALLTAAIVLSALPVTGHPMARAEGAAEEVTVIENESQVSACLDPLTCGEGEQLLPVTIDPAEGTAVVDGSGEEASIREVYALSGRESRELTGGSDAENREAVRDYLLQEPCVVHEQEDGTLRAAYPFAIKILFLLLEEGQLEDTCGAVNAVYDAEGGRYVLQYDTQEAAASAYAQLAETWGREKVLIDLPVAPSEVKYDTTKQDQTVSSFTTAKSLSWGTDAMYLDQLRDWTEEHPAQGTLKVAVIDTGIRVDETKEELINGYGIDTSRILKSYCQAITSSVYNYTALHDTSGSGWQPKKCAYADLKGHGTHVMSTILDGTPSQVKVFAIRDACTNPSKYNSTRYATGDIDAMVKSVTRAGERGAKVVNMSQGIDCYDYEKGTWKGYYGKGISSMENITFDTFCAYNNELARIIGVYDLCVVTAAGNSGKNTADVMHFPAMNNGVVEVSNLTYKSGSPILNSSSNYGENVSFCAPGTAIVGAGYDWDSHSACYSTKSGTSMATPHISAALAILRLYYPNLDNMGAVELLKEFCTDLGEAGRDDYYGFGFPRFNTVCKMNYVYNDSVTKNLELTLPKGMKLTRPEDPERWGYTFGGWYTDYACSQKFEFSKPVLKSSYLYAKWNRVYKQVKYYYNGHGGTTKTESVPLGEDIPRPTDPQEEGWKFCGWYSDPALTSEFYFSTPIYDSLSLYAKWEKEEDPVKAITPTVTLSPASYTYDGAVKTPKVTVKDGSTVLEEGTDYTVSYASGRRDAGKYKVAVTLTGGYAGSASKTFTIKKAANPLSVKGKKAAVKYSKVKKKTQTLAASKVLTISKKGKGAMTYTKSSGNKKITVAKKTGTVTVKKGIKKGTYQVKLKVKAAGNANYQASPGKTVTVQIKVK